MKKKEIVDFAQNVTIELSYLDIPCSISESKSTSSAYIHFIHTGDLVRIADHGYKYELFNFLPGKTIIRKIEQGKYFYSMNNDGISAFINDFLEIYNIQQIVKKLKIIQI